MSVHELFQAPVQQPNRYARGQAPVYTRGVTPVYARAAEVLTAPRMITPTTFARKFEGSAYRR
jgi:hypothetical protein